MQARPFYHITTTDMTHTYLACAAMIIAIDPMIYTVYMQARPLYGDSYSFFDSILYLKAVILVKQAHYKG